MLLKHKRKTAVVYTCHLVCAIVLISDPFSLSLKAVNSVRESAQPTMTPTQAAKILARIGDEVKDEYSQQISMTVTRLLIHKVSELTYQQFKDISTDMIDKRLPGWRQVCINILTLYQATHDY